MQTKIIAMCNFVTNLKPHRSTSKSQRKCQVNSGAFRWFDGAV